MKVIAEIANTHEGDISYFFKHINELFVSGIKNIKVQYIIPSELGNPGSASFKEFSRLEIKENEYLELLSRFKSTNFFFDVFGNQSLDSVINLSKKYTNIKGIKFHTTNSMNFDLIIEASKFFNVIFGNFIKSFTNSSSYSSTSLKKAIAKFTLSKSFFRY